MTNLDDLPQMVSLSPEPITSLDDTNMFSKKASETLPGFRRHNWDAEAIEVLWKQDCDLGLTRSDFAPVRPLLAEEDVVPQKPAGDDQKWCPEGCKLEVPSGEGAGDSLEDIWAGLDYTVDSETGEYVLRMPGASEPPAAPATPGPVAGLMGSAEALPIPTTIADLVTADHLTNNATPQEPVSRLRRLTHSSDSGRESLVDSDSGDLEIQHLSDILDTTHNPSGGAQQPLLRMVSIEERWQDLASILRLPEQTSIDTAPPAVAQPTLFTEHCDNQTDFTTAPSQQRISSLTAAPQQLSPLTRSSAGLDNRLPPSPDGQPQYFQLSPLAAPPAPLATAPTLDQESTFLSQLLGVDDLDIVDASAAPQLWMQSADDQAAGPPVVHTSSPASKQQKFGSLGAASGSAASPEGNGQRRQPPVAQKKHQMYGKRIFSEQQQDEYDGASPGGSSGGGERHPAPASPVPQQYGSEAGVQGTYPGAHVPSPGEAAALPSPVEPKYSGTAEFAAVSAEPRLSPVAHNHSYHQPSPAQSGSQTRRPVARDKERQSRDDRRTREMNIPMTADEIVHLPMDEFNERLSKMQLTEAQLCLVRDVRRRGKNKMAAQNCRKRKLDQIQSLADDLQRVRDQRRQDLADHQTLMAERSRIRDKYSQLHRHVFQSLRDEEGRPYSASQYSLQLSADGDVLLVPRGSARGAAFVPPDPSTGARRKQ